MKASPRGQARLRMLTPEYRRSHACFMLVCNTGKGEYFVRSVCAYDISARMQYGGASLKQAAHDCIHDGMRKTVVPPGEYMSVCFVVRCTVRSLEVVSVCRVV
jgi:hypothetical protein